MNHYLCILGPDGALQPLFERGMTAFARITRRPEALRRTEPGVALAVFPGPGHNLSGLEASPSGALVGASSGTLFHNHRVGRPALTGLLEDLERAWSDPLPTTATLDGFFTVIALHRARREVLVATDLIGAAHVFRARFGECTLISTSSLVLASLTGASVDPEGARQVIATGTFFETPRTLFQGVEKLLPASLHTFGADGSHKSRVFWDPKEVLRDRKPGARVGSVEQLGSALVDTVRMIRENFKRPLFDLSGGLDTRSILAAAMRGGSAPEVIVNGPVQDPDVIASKRIAERFNIKLHHRFDRLLDKESLWREVQTALSLCDGEIDALTYSFISYVHLQMSQEFDVTVNGCGGEFCKGYYWELLLPFLGKHAPLDAYRIASRRFVFMDDEPGLFAAPFKQSLSDHMAGVVRTAIEGMEDTRNTAQLDLVYMRLRVQRFYGRIASSTSQIWPVTSPYCFRAPIEACITTPPWQRRAEKMSRRLNEHLHPGLANMPLERGHPAVPLRITNAHRFWPLAKENLTAVTRRVLRNLGIPLMQEVWLPFTGELRRSELLGIPDVAAMLEPATMATESLWDPKVLRGLVERWRQDSGLDHRMARILTVELAARTARAAAAG